uniref:Photosystem II protein N n=1 Tax=Cuscuta boldinghii TaxID=437623 RepID=A0A4Y5MZ37_9ASTE|nr:photosystem II protein N [Cuscuta boldinghii]QCW07736.1 photosystem II protein N [Cuscuta boldinghii]
MKPATLFLSGLLMIFPGYVLYIAFGWTTLPTT